jgi:ABC transporter transmembrane protein
MPTCTGCRCGFHQTKTGEIQSRLANDVGGIQQVVTEAASLIRIDIVVLVSTVGAMVMLSWQLTVLSLALMPLFVWLTCGVSKHGHGVELGLCGVFLFVDQATQDGSACDLFVVAVGDGVVWSGRAELATAVGSSTVVVSGVGRQDGS